MLFAARRPFRGVSALSITDFGFMHHTRNEPGRASLPPCREAGMRNAPTQQETRPPTESVPHRSNHDEAGFLSSNSAQLAFLNPFGMEHLTAWIVDSLIRMRPEVVTLSLQQIGGKSC